MTGVGTEEVEGAAAQALTCVSEQGAGGGGSSDGTSGMCRWVRRKHGSSSSSSGSLVVELVHQHPVAQVAWHARGDYFATVCPAGNTQVRPAAVGIRVAGMVGVGWVMWLGVGGCSQWEAGWA